ncbi:MAG: winged helix-turn-helix domain-containing protein [Chloroflexi bacterium]|nr:winged helix-turn-helix domain-containing protein [Chloroflexota bacterium]
MTGRTRKGPWACPLIPNPCPLTPYGKISAMKVTREQLTQTESQTYQIRLLAILVVAFLVYWFFPAGASIWTPVVVAGSYLLYTMVLHYFVLPRFFHPYMVFGIMAADWVLAATALWVLGVASAAFLLFPLLVGYHAIYLGYAGSLASATIASFISLGLAAQRWDPGALSTVAFRIPLLYIVAAISGYISRERSRERDARLGFQEALRAEQKSRELLGMVQEMHQDPAKVLQNVASAAVSASGARQALIFLKDAGGRRLQARAAFPPQAEGGVKDIAGIEEALGEHWLDRAGVEGGALVLSAGEIPAWARALPEARIVGIPIISGERKLGVMYLLANGSVAADELRRAGDYIAPLAAATVSDAERYVRAEKEADELLHGLRRSVERMGHVREAQDRRPLTRGALTLNPGRGQALLGDKPLSLSPTEFEVLYYLAERAGQTVNQATLLSEVWGDELVAHSNLVDVCIYRLRRKLAQHPGGKELIATARGAGYLFQAK